MKIWIKPHPKGSTLSLHIQPGAKKSELVGEHGERLKVKIKAPPQDGEANLCLIQFLADLLKLPKAKVHLISGESSRQKLVLVELSPEEVLTLL
ncbi:MAG: DUF167 domain-containing protein [Bacteriovoracaceae bacterium]|nr:DUF167 domain-containing protein [Bacteriovoracaceae bacterium]